MSDDRYPAWPEMFRWLTVLKDRVETLPVISAEQVVTGTFDPSMIPPIPWDDVLKAGSSLADLETRSASDLSSGTLPSAQMPALTGDVTSVAGDVATTLATVNGNVGTFGSGAKVPLVTVNAKGQVTAVSEQPIVLASGGYTIGDLLTANSATTLTTLHDVAVGQVLVSGGVGVIPAWSANPSISGTLTVTGVSSLRSGLNILGPSGGTVPPDMAINGHLFRSNIAGNVATFQQMQNAGFSAIRFVDDGGVEHGAIGYGNSGSGAYASQVFIETLLASNTAFVPLRLRQTQTSPGSGSAIRQEFASDGTINMWWSPPAGGTAPQLFLLNSAGITLAGDTVFKATNVAGSTKFEVLTSTGAVNVKAGLLSVTDAAATGGSIAFFDANASIYGREGGVDVLNFYSFGGTLAAAKGHRFSTGGVKASQTLRLQVADDGIYANSVVGIGTATISALAHVQGTTEQLRLGYDSTHIASFTTSSAGDLSISTTTNNLILTGSGDPRIVARNTSATANKAAGVQVDATAQTANAKWTMLTGQTAQGQAADAFTLFNVLFGAAPLVVTASSVGRVGINATAPTAQLHIGAGTASANTAPLKFTSGTVLTTPVAGVVEFTTDDYFATITTGAARKAFILDDGARLTSGSVAFATTNGRLTDDNANLFWDDSNNRLGVGTASPQTTLDVLSAASQGGFRVRNTQANIPTLTIGISNVGSVDWRLQNQSGDLRFNDGGSADRVTFKLAGNVGIGTTGPTAVLHLKAGTATASSAPLKLTSGTNLTTAEAGAVEYNGTNLFFTRAGTVRENVLVAIDNVAAPTTNAGTPTTRYGGDTKYLGDPDRWLSVNVLGATYKIPLYT